MKKIPSGPMFLTRTLRHPGGPAPQRPGGPWLPITITGWVVLSGPVLITGESPHLTSGPTSLPISVSWMFVVFQKIFITTTKAGGQIKMCCIFRRTGTGREKKASRLMFG